MVYILLFGWITMLVACAPTHQIEKMDNLKEVRKKLLNKVWIQVSDTPSGWVYQPLGAETPKPRGRGGGVGRMRMEFRDDGTCRVSGVGPSDRPQTEECTWRLEKKDGLILHIISGSDDRKRLLISDIETDSLLIVKK